MQHGKQIFSPKKRKIGAHLNLGAPRFLLCGALHKILQVEGKYADFCIFWARNRERNRHGWGGFVSY